MKRVRMLFLGPGGDTILEQGFRRTAVLLGDTWREPSFGIVRVTRLVTYLALFMFPTIYIDNVARSTQRNVIGFCRELYFISSFLFISISLLLGWHSSKWIVGLVIYLMAEIVVFSSGKVFVWGRLSLDPARSLLLAIMNYFEMIVGFAVLYRHWNCLPSTPSDPLNATKALYFSLVTATTVGYGDIVPFAEGRGIVMAQLAIFFLFIAVFLAVLQGRAGTS